MTKLLLSKWVRQLQQIPFGTIIFNYATFYFLWEFTKNAPFVQVNSLEQQLFVSLMKNIGKIRLIDRNNLETFLRKIDFFLISLSVEERVLIISRKIQYYKKYIISSTVFFSNKITFMYLPSCCCIYRSTL